MSTYSQIAFSNSNTVGKTGLLTYTCTGDASTKFGLDLINTPGYKKISINLPDENDFVTTTAIDSLAGIQIWHYPASKATRVKVQLSRDSIHWTAPLSQDYMYEKESIHATFVPGRYYVRITNSTNDDVSLWQIMYTFGSCNCVMYIPE